MPKKIRELITDLKTAGFKLDRQKGSHRQFIHPGFGATLTLSGNDGSDAKRYQEKQVTEAIAIAKKST